MEIQPYNNNNVPSREWLEYNSPYSVMYEVNPELASLAYMHQHVIQDPAILDRLVQFRSLQSQEKVTLLREITRRIEAEYEMNTAKYHDDTSVRLKQIEESIQKYAQDVIKYSHDIDREKEVLRSKAKLAEVEMAETFETIRKGMDVVSEGIKQGHSDITLESGKIQVKYKGS